VKRLGDLSEPWKCPPSLERVFAKRHAAQALRRARGAARKAERQLRDTQYYETFRRRDQRQMTIKIFTIAQVPDELQQAWLQHLRDFDTAHPGCHFEVMIDAPESTLAEAVAALHVNPELTFQQILVRKP
jgi:hypothetical protein